MAIGYVGQEPLTSVNGIDYSNYEKLWRHLGLMGDTGVGGTSAAATTDPGAVDPIRPDDPNAPGPEKPAEPIIPGIGLELQAALQSQGLWPPPQAWLQAFMPQLIGTHPLTTFGGTTTPGPTGTTETPKHETVVVAAPPPAEATATSALTHQAPGLNMRTYLSPQTRAALYGETPGPNRPAPF